MPQSEPDISRLELRDLRLVVAINAEGSLTKAGARLHVTQPALSRHLAQLEARLGIPLFTRTGSRMQPTAAGELLLRHARELLDRVAATEQELQKLNNAPRRKLRVGTDCYTAYHWLPGILSRFTARYPAVDVEIAFDAVRQPVKYLRAGTVDIALFTDGKRPAGCQVELLFTDEYIAVVAPGHAWAQRTHVDARDFATERLLLLTPPDQSSVMKRFIRPSGVKPRYVADVQLIGAVAALAESEFGVGIVPSWTIAPEVRAGRLVPLRLGRHGFRRQWAAAMRPAQARESVVQDFVRTIATGGPALGLQPQRPTHG